MVALTIHILIARAGVMEINSVIAGKTVPVGPTRDGRIKQVAVEKSGPFKAGDLLFEIEDPSLLKEIDSTSQTIRQLKEQLEQTSSPIRKSQAVVAVDEKILDVKGLIQAGQIDIQTKRRLLEVAERTLKKLEAKINEPGGPLRAQAELDYLRTLDQREVLTGEISLLENNLNAAHSKLEWYSAQKITIEQELAREVNGIQNEIAKYERLLGKSLEEKRQLTQYAAFDGYVVDRLKEPGDSARYGEPILKITDGKEIWIGAYFPPRYSELINEGDRLLVTYQNETFPVSVNRVGVNPSTIPKEPTDVLSFREKYIAVRLDFLDPEQARSANLLAGVPFTMQVTRTDGLFRRWANKAAGPAPGATIHRQTPIPETHPSKEDKPPRRVMEAALR